MSADIPPNDFDLSASLRSLGSSADSLGSVRAVRLRNRFLRLPRDRQLEVAAAAEDFLSARKGGVEAYEWLDFLDRLPGLDEPPAAETQIESVGDLVSLRYNDTPSAEELRNVTTAAEKLMGSATHLLQQGAFKADDGTEQDVLDTIESLRKELAPASGRAPRPQSVEGHLLTLTEFVAEATGIAVALDAVQELSVADLEKGAIDVADTLADAIDPSKLPEDLDNREEVVAYVAEHGKETAGFLLGWVNTLSDASKAVLDSLADLKNAAGLGAIIGTGAGFCRRRQHHGPGRSRIRNRSSQRGRDRRDPCDPRQLPDNRRGVSASGRWGGFGKFAL